MKKQVHEILTEMNACDEAVQMSKIYGDDLEKAWNEWPRGDHLLWLYRRAKNYDLQTLTLAKGHCANTVRHLMRDKRSTDAVDMAIKFGEGNATLAELNAAYAADAYAADAAAYAAAYVADAARLNAKKANQMATAEMATAEMATADICRKYLPIPIL